MKSVHFYERNRLMKTEWWLNHLHLLRRNGDERVIGLLLVPGHRTPQVGAKKLVSRISFGMGSLVNESSR
jgi:hypothetical protein